MKAWLTKVQKQKTTLQIVRVAEYDRHYDEDDREA